VLLLAVLPVRVLLELEYSNSKPLYLLPLAVLVLRVLLELEERVNQIGSNKGEA